MAIQVNLRVSKELLARVDKARGLVPRNAWLVSLIEAKLDAEDEFAADRAETLRRHREAVETAPGNLNVTLDDEGALRVKDPAKPAEVIRVFRCPMKPCDFSAKSPKARCPSHGRTVVPHV